MTSFRTDRSIPELIASASSDEPSLSSLAARELFRRHDECTPHAKEIVGLLSNGSAAIEDFAYRTLASIGKPATPAIVGALDVASGRTRSYLLSLLSSVAEFETFFPVLESEMHSDDEAIRYHAANCLGRSYDPDNSWPDHAMSTLDRAIELLRSCRENPEALQYWSQARMTLKHPGLIKYNKK